MGEFAIPILIATTAVSAGVTAKTSIDAGRQADKEAKAQAQRETDAARTREIERKRALVRALASQSARAGVVGASPDLSVTAADLKYSADDLLTDKANTAWERNTLAAYGKNRKRAGTYGAAGSLLDAGASIAGAYVKP